MQSYQRMMQVVSRRLPWVVFPLVMLASFTSAWAQPKDRPRIAPRYYDGRTITERREAEDQRLRRPSLKTRGKINKFLQADYPLDAILKIDPVRSRLMRFRIPIQRLAITDPAIVQITQYEPGEVEFIGNQTGETVVTFWFGDVGEQPTIFRYLVIVEPAGSDQARREYGELQNRINELFPNSQIQLIPILDKLVVRGQARDAEEAVQIMSIIRGEAVNQAGIVGFGTGVVQGAAVAPIPGAEELQAFNVINMLEVPGEKQVMLKVRIAELTRSALRQMAVDFSINEANFMLGPILRGAGNITAIFEGGEETLFLQALASNGMSKILAEPVLVTLSGRPASFIVGGQFAVPTTVGIEGVAAATTTFQGFGTQLSFLPVVLDKDRIRLSVTPTFSSVNQGLAVGGIPGLNTRSVNTTVDLREGQWLALAGLVQDEQRSARQRIPFIGDLPFLGTFFGDQEAQRDETELVVLVSPELVHPLEAKQVPLKLPGWNYTEAGDFQFYFNRGYKGHPDSHHRSTVWPDQRDAIRRANLRALEEKRHCDKGKVEYQHMEKYYIIGPHGFSN